MLDSIGITGQWSAEIIRADGSVENYKQANAIETAFKQKVVDAMVGNDSSAIWRMGGALHSNDGSGQGLFLCNTPLLLGCRQYRLLAKEY